MVVITGLVCLKFWKIQASDSDCACLNPYEPMTRDNPRRFSRLDKGLPLLHRLQRMRCSLNVAR